MDTIRQLSRVGNCTALNHGRRATDDGPRTAFTLVELLVVITIIGILASLITVAAVAALKNAQQTRIKVELGQIATALDEYKNKVTAYPPNCQTDGTGEPIDEPQILSDIKRHLKQIAPRHREDPELIARLVGLTASGAQLPSNQGLQGGMTAGEAIVFWLGGFSSDPKYPISGEGGPSYAVVDPARGINIAAGVRHEADNISNRNWIYPFEITRLGPRNDNDYFDPSTNRFIEYQVNTGSGMQTRRINFWQYVPAKSEQPFLYFDTSRHPAFDVTTGVELSRFDPPAATALSGLELHVHAIKKRNDATGTNVAPVQFIEPEKFQVLHCGNDGDWGVEAFERMSAHGLQQLGLDPFDVDNYLLFPNGPFTGEVADTVTNFATQNKIEDAQP